MNKLTLILFLLLFNNIGLKAQNLTINETIDYINNNIEGDSKIEINKTGILSFTQPTVKHLRFKQSRHSNNCSGYYSISNKEKTYTHAQLSNKTKSEIHISNLDLIKILEPGKTVWEHGELCSNEWSVGVICNKNKVFHKYDGDCIEYTSEGWNHNDMNNVRKEYRSSFQIQTKDGDKSTSEKVKNALSYLINLAKEKGYDAKEDEEYDPFASDNFNTNQFEIESEKNLGNIQLTNQNGVYYIDISIGNISKKFILDTGASDVLISKEYERQLISKGFLRKEHYIPSGLYRIADGSIIKCRRLLIPKLKIGGFILTNVQASVVNSGDTMLLGQSVLEKFGSWHINNITKTLELNK